MALAILLLALRATPSSAAPPTQPAPTVTTVGAPRPAAPPEGGAVRSTNAQVASVRVDVTCTSAASSPDGDLEIAISSSSGFAVADGVVVTAASAVTPSGCAADVRPTVTVTVRGAAPVVAAVDRVDQAGGVAILSAPGVHGVHGVHGVQGAGTGAAASARTGGRACAVVSVPEPALLCGVVAGVARRRSAWMSFVAPRGSGGAPVVDEAGAVIGVLTSTARCADGRQCGTILSPISPISGIPGIR